MEAQFFNYMTTTLSGDWGALLLRLVIGFGLLPWGIKKICERSDADKFPKVLFFSPSFGFYTAMCIETLAAVCMISGFCVRLIAIPAICNMAIATNVSKGKFFATPALTFLLGFIAILILGPGKFSLDYLLF